jgi:hypothetical protein
MRFLKAPPVMATSRDKFIKVQARILDERFKFAPDEKGARLRFEQLALDTHLSGARGYDGPFAPSDRFDQPGACDLPPSLLQRWKRWHEEYQEVLERSPRLALRDMLHQIAESNMQTSWPYGLERRIQEWIDSGDMQAVPFIDGYGIVTAAFYTQLRTLRQRCMGWMRYDSTSNHIVFVPEAEWQRLCVAEDERIAGH